MHGVFIVVPVAVYSYFILNTGYGSTSYILFDSDHLNVRAIIGRKSIALSLI